MKQGKNNVILPDMHPSFMKHIILSAFFIALAALCIGQEDTTGKVRFKQGVHFADGVYANFNEWKNNSPRINQFQTIKSNSFGVGDVIEIHYNCKGDDGTAQNCEIKNCFGYVQNGSLFISQGFYGRFFRVFIVGRLTHFIAYSGYDNPDAYFTSEPNGLIGAANDLREYVLDFSTGDTYEFSYKTFAYFLKERDHELYLQLQASKQKRKMIHHFLLKYNERHPIYIQQL
jgi:hypothetical protein